LKEDDMLDYSGYAIGNNNPIVISMEALDAWVARYAKEHPDDVVVDDLQVTSPGVC
jgi:hypothetical protein